MKKRLYQIAVGSLLFSACNYSTDQSSNSNELTDSKTTNETESTVKTEEIPKKIITDAIEPPLIVQEVDIYPKGNLYSLETGKKVDKKNWENGSPYRASNGILYEGRVAITYKEFQGHSPYNIPFVAVIRGSISELYLDGKKIKIEQEGEIFFRQKIVLENGYNRVPVKAVGKSGRVTEDFIEISVHDVPDRIEIN